MVCRAPIGDGAGVLASLPTVLTGATEWAETERSDENIRRLGIVHATAIESAASPTRPPAARTVSTSLLAENRKTPSRRDERCASRRRGVYEAGDVLFDGYGSTAAASARVVQSS